MQSVVTPEMLKEAAREKIVSRRRRIISELDAIRAEQAKMAAKAKALENELDECAAAARLFEIKVTETATEARLMHLRGQMREYELRADHSEEGSQQRAIFYQRARRIQDEIKRLSEQSEADQPSLALVDELVPALKPAAPKVKDVILAQLKAAPITGRKAIYLREYYEQTYSAKLHEKTIGMTLFRLSKDNAVHRIKQTWFYGPQAGRDAPPASAENPGAVTPGQTHDAD